MIDNPHLVASSGEAEYPVTEVVGMKNTMRGGEGLATAVIGVVQSTSRRRISGR